MIKKYLLVLSLLIIFPFFNVNSLQSAGGSSFSLDLVSQYGEGGLYVKNVVIDGNYLYTKNFEGHNI